MKKVDWKVLSELVKNARVSDRELAKKVGVSQPTVSRTRNRLEKRGLIKEYIAIPDFSKLGFEILAVHFYNWRSEEYEKLRVTEDFQDRINKFVSEHPGMILASSGRGLGMTRIAITLHKSYSNFNKYTQDVERSWGKYFEKYETFIISLQNDIILRLFDFKNLGELGTSES